MLAAVPWPKSSASPFCRCSPPAPAAAPLPFASPPLAPSPILHMLTIDFLALLGFARDVFDC
jgi:hypothetical protein